VDYANCLNMMETSRRPSAEILWWRRIATARTCKYGARIKLTCAVC
jgi:hypothetical protein